MGSSVSRIVGCIIRPREASSDGGVGVLFSEPLDEGLGHSFCYVRPHPVDSPPTSPLGKDVSGEFPSPDGKFGSDHASFPDETPASELKPVAGRVRAKRCIVNFFNRLCKVSDEKVKSNVEKCRSLPEKPTTNGPLDKTKLPPETSFKAISGASVSANTATPRSIMSTEQFNSFSNVLYDRAAAFESTSSFSALPLQPVPRGFSGSFSGPLERGDRGFLSGPLERGFLSGPLERGFLSGPLERGYMSGPLETVDRSHFSAPLGGVAGVNPYSSNYLKSRKNSLMQLMKGMSKPMRKAITRTASTFARPQKSTVAPVKGNLLKDGKEGKEIADKDFIKAQRKSVDSRVDAEYISSELDLRESDNLQWAQGKAGEDRVHVVLSEENAWLFVGIYDGFNGPDAPDFLMSNLYPAVYQELKGLLWNKKEENTASPEWNTQGSAEVEAEAEEDSKGGQVNPIASVHGRDPGKVGDARKERRAGNPGLVHVGRDSRRRVRRILGRNGDRIRPGFAQMAGDELATATSWAEWKTVDRRTVSNDMDQNLPRACECDSFAKFQQSEAGDEVCRDGEEDVVQSSCHHENEHGESLAMEQEGKLVEDKVTEHMEEEDVRSQSEDGTDEVCQSKTHKPTRRKHGIRLRYGHERRKEQLRKYFQWRYDWDPEGDQSMDPALSEDLTDNVKRSSVDHAAILKALARALQSTEDAYLDMADKALFDFPELALMGSCVLVMLMKGEDVYILNVGDSRAVLAQQPKVEPFNGKVRSCSQSTGNDSNDRNGPRESVLQLERIIEETPMELEALETAHDNATVEGPLTCGQSLLGALQLTSDHSTSIDEEVLRIKSEHSDDDTIHNDRVKGRLKVTRAFGAGFLKQPKWNNALLEMFRIDFIGTNPYITCTPALYHHRLGPQDHFLVLSSDGLYQYFSNEEVVSHVEWFMEKFPDGDPAQHLIEELLFRAAKKAGMDFHELLDIPQGDRRKYHDDVSVMVISLEGRIWRSSG